MKNVNKNSYHKLPILDGLELFSAKNHTLNFPLHTHNTFNITLTFDQTFSTKLCDRFLQAPARSIVITNPHEVHATICENKIGSSFFTFYISPDILKRLNRQRTVFFEDKMIDDAFLFRQMYTLSQNFNKQDVEKVLLAALKQLVTKYANNTISYAKKTNLFQRFLQEDTCEKFSLENTAKKFGLDKYKFLRLFKQQTGLTPNNYVILKRIEKCKELLRSQHDLLDIAIETGFYDDTHLCKHFRKITGITPLAYRNA